MAARKLTANVWVNGEFYAAGAAPEKAVADLIENPKAWAQADEAPAADEGGQEQADEAPAADEGGQEQADEAPARRSRR